MAAGAAAAPSPTSARSRRPALTTAGVLTDFTSSAPQNGTGGEPRNGTSGEPRRTYRRRRRPAAGRGPHRTRRPPGPRAGERLPKRRSALRHVHFSGRFLRGNEAMRGPSAFPRAGAALHAPSPTGPPRRRPPPGTPGDPPGREEEGGEGRGRAEAMPPRAAAGAEKRRNGSATALGKERWDLAHPGDRAGRAGFAILPPADALGSAPRARAGNCSGLVIVPPPMLL